MSPLLLGRAWVVSADTYHVSFPGCHCPFFFFPFNSRHELFDFCPELEVGHSLFLIYCNLNPEQLVRAPGLEDACKRVFWDARRRICELTAGVHMRGPPRSLYSEGKAVSGSSPTLPSCTCRGTCQCHLHSRCWWDEGTSEKAPHIGPDSRGRRSADDVCVLSCWGASPSLLPSPSLWLCSVLGCGWGLSHNSHDVGGRPERCFLDFSRACDLCQIAFEEQVLTQESGAGTEVLRLDVLRWCCCCWSVDHCSASKLPHTACPRRIDRRSRMWIGQWSEVTGGPCPHVYTWWKVGSLRFLLGIPS